MARAFKYRVCQVQMARVTFVNGQWQGLQVLENANPTELYNSCPMVWDYLEAAGREGWELVTTSALAVSQGEVGNMTSLLFLKKEL
jgi:hypothetical protein